MSYVENCNKHGQYHADYICGDCVEDLQKELSTLRTALDVAKNQIEKRSDEALYKAFAYALGVEDARGWTIGNNIIDFLNKGD